MNRSKGKCIIVCNAVEGKLGVYFNCPIKFSPNTQTFIIHYTENRKQFPLRVLCKSNAKHDNMLLTNEKPPFSITTLVIKNHNQKKQYEKRMGIEEIDDLYC